MAGVGIGVSLVGGLILNALLVASPALRLSVSALVYGSLGFFSVLLGLRGLGIMKYSIPIPGFQTLSQLFSGKAIQLKGSRRRMLAYGALYGGGMAAACPVPVYWALLFWAALIGNPAFGALLLGLHGLGYVAPLIVIVLLMKVGLSNVKSLVGKGHNLENLLAGGLITFGIFLIVIWVMAEPVGQYLEQFRR
jgi:cytochrome c biogenesis protein CcdA